MTKQLGIVIKEKPPPPAITQEATPAVEIPVAEVVQAVRVILVD